METADFLARLGPPALYSSSVIAGILATLTVPRLVVGAAHHSLTRSLQSEDVERWNRWRQEHPAATPVLRGVNLNLHELPNVNCAATRITRCTFRGATLSGAMFSQSTLADVSFDDADLEGADFAESRLVNPQFAGTSVRAEQFRGASIEWMGESITADRLLELQCESPSGKPVSEAEQTLKIGGWSWYRLAPSKYVARPRSDGGTRHLIIWRDIQDGGKVEYNTVQRANDLRKSEKLDKVVILSPDGFTPDAERYAKWHSKRVMLLRLDIGKGAIESGGDLAQLAGKSRAVRTNFR